MLRNFIRDRGTPADVGHVCGHVRLRGAGAGLRRHGVAWRLRAAHRGDRHPRADGRGAGRAHLLHPPHRCFHPAAAGDGQHRADLAEAIDVQGGGCARRAEGGTARPRSSCWPARRSGAACWPGRPAGTCSSSIDEWLSDPADDQRYEVSLRSLLGAVEALEDGSGPDDRLPPTEVPESAITAAYSPNGPGRGTETEGW